MFEFKVKTSSCYVGIFDLASPVREIPLKRVMEQASSEASVAGEPWATLFYFNEGILRYMRRGEILAWTLILDGCFKARVKIQHCDDGDPTATDRSGYLGNESHDLICPSGKIAVADLVEMDNQNLSPSFEIDPGAYRVWLNQDWDQEIMHCTLENESDYPIGDGPDWILTLRRIA